MELFNKENAPKVLLGALSLAVASTLGLQIIPNAKSGDHFTAEERQCIILTDAISGTKEGEIKKRRDLSKQLRASRCNFPFEN